jgi:fluoride ion exporter CrcB/FEX
MSPDLAATIWIGLGGGFGGVARYAIERLMIHFVGSEFPWGTFVVNVVGSFLIGYLGMPVLTDASFEAVPDLRFLLAIGVFGGLRLSRFLACRLSSFCVTARSSEL